MSERNVREILDILRSHGEQALAFDAFAFRRAFGIYYSVWAATIASFVFLPYVVPYALPPGLQQFAYPAIYILAGVIATLFSTKIFSEAGKIIKLKNSVEGYSANRKRRSWIRVVDWLFIILLMFLLSVSFHSMIRFVLLFIFLIGIDFYVYNTLRKTFGKLPPEGIFATVVFGFSTISSFAFGILLGDPVYFDIFWIPTIIGWFGASLYSLYRAPEDLVSLNAR